MTGTGVLKSANVKSYVNRTISQKGAGGETAEVSRESTKQTKMIAEQETNFWKACDKRHYSTKLLNNTFE